jgi:uncharacterized phosphosugar-binding protein
MGEEHQPESARGPGAGASPVAALYLQRTASVVSSLLEGQEEAFASATEAVKRCMTEDGLIYLFGTGHSHMLAEEGHYRAGGLACVAPILASAVMLHEGATASTRMERLPGLAEPILSRYPIGSRDVVVVFSTSGVNAAPVEAAKYARAAGATVLAVTSEAYSRQSAQGRERLADVASIVLDNRVPPGDASVALSDRVRAGPLSTVAGAALLNALFVEASARLIAEGGEPPVYVSANMPGAAERNAALVARFRARIQHL